MISKTVRRLIAGTLISAASLTGYAGTIGQDTSALASVTEHADVTHAAGNIGDKYTCAMFLQWANRTHDGERYAPGLIRPMVGYSSGASMVILFDIAHLAANIPNYPSNQVAAGVTTWARITYQDCARRLRPAQPAITTTAVHRPGCAAQLAAIRTVATAGGVTVGDSQTVPLTAMIPGRWAATLRTAGLYRLAADAAAISDPRTDSRYVTALTSKAGELLTDCSR